VSLLGRKSSHHAWISSSLPLPRPYISFSPLLVPKSFSSVDESEQDEDNVSLVASLNEINDDGQEDGSELTMVSMRENRRSSALELSAKEKRKLASYAHHLGDKLKSQLVGKSGVTDSVVLSFVETLEKNELLKVKIHRTCPGELEDMILRLEEATGSVSVGQIARTVILYRPSPTKLKADEDKKRNEE
jgi:RNA-binding protein